MLHQPNTLQTVGHLCHRTQELLPKVAPGNDRLACALPLCVHLCVQERAELLASNRKEIGALLEARAAAESTFTDKYLAAVETYAQNLEHLRHADAEEYQVLKIK